MPSHGLFLPFHGVTLPIPWSDPAIPRTFPTIPRSDPTIPRVSHPSQHSRDARDDIGQPMLHPTSTSPQDREQNSQSVAPLQLPAQEHHGQEPSEDDEGVLEHLEAGGAGHVQHYGKTAGKVLRVCWKLPKTLRFMEYGEILYFPK
ncbi:hypothetical protein HGM15179_017531 [Zosterops borbonicus]|uniref:Uncharacterized protein n=1 Tax=Zosterops borbonicus TaxID=364589 RepID=A0A8K1G0V1_9PASS|nr:hypothetical protein HGM15179_017531 [Zosterops borbonicus]